MSEVQNDSRIRIPSQNDLQMPSSNLEKGREICLRSPDSEGNMRTPQVSKVLKEIEEDVSVKLAKREQGNASICLPVDDQVKTF